MENTFARYDTLRADLAALTGHGPFMRAYKAPHLFDAEIAARTWQAFQPGLPVTLAGGLFAAVGFCLGSMAGRVATSVLRNRRSVRRVEAA
jgi:hypothetical protein